MNDLYSKIILSDINKREKNFDEILETNKKLTAFIDEEVNDIDKIIKEIDQEANEPHIRN